MRILIFTPQFLPMLSGITFRVQMMTRYFVENHHHVTIVTTNPTTVSKFEVGPVCVDVLHLPAQPINKLLSGNQYNDLYQLKPLQSYEFLDTLCQDRHFDIIHCFGPDIMEPFIRVANNYNIAITMSYNTELVEFMQKSTSFNLNVCLFINRFCNFLLCVNKVPLIIGTSNESIRVNRQRNIITTNQRTALMLPVIDHDKFKPTTGRTGLFRSNVFKLIYCGRIAPEKEVTTLIHYMQHIKNAQLTIIGGGGDVDKCKELINRFDLQDTVQMIGKVDNHLLAEYYSAADAFVTASTCETCGFTTIEAMACGLPAIVYKAGGSIDLVQHETNGFYFTDRDSFISAVETLQSNQPLVVQMSRNAIKSVEQYSIQHSCEDLLNHYRQEIALKKPIPMKFKHRKYIIYIGNILFNFIYHVIVSIAKITKCPYSRSS